MQKRIESLPEPAADFIYSTEMGALAKQIADKHHLHIDQMSLLEAEAGELMLGLTEPQEFVPNLIDSLSVDKAKAEVVAKDINDELMLKIRGMMGSPKPPVSPSMPSVVPPIVPAPAPKPPTPAPQAATPARPQTPPATPAPAAVKPTAPTPVMPSPNSTPKTAASNLAAADAMLSEK